MDFSEILQGLAPRVDPLIQGAAAVAVALALGFIAFVIVKLFGGRFLERVVVPAARFADRLLLDRIAPLTGIKFENFWLRWGVYWFVFLGLAVIGSLPPVALGLGAVLAALIAILAIYRQWEQDETERRLLEDAGDAIPFRNDYRNELLIGLTVMMGFFAIGFSRLEELSPLYSGDPRLPVASTAMFIWGEFLKAIPLVDASEVYGWRNISGLEASGGVGRTATFTVRVIFDLVIIAALIRTVDIIRRITSGLDLRQIERDLATGDIASINAAITELAKLAMRGRLNALRVLTDIALTRRINGKVSALNHREDAARALMDITELRGDLAIGLVAVEGLNAVARGRNREASPLDWAGTQNTLGNALVVLGEMAGDPARLEEAVQAYQNALEVYTCEAGPANWAMAQNNLGNALQVLGEMAGDPARLEEAVQAYRNALEVYTREASPADWAMTQNNLGIALGVLGGMAGDPVRLEEAKAIFEDLAVFRTERGDAEAAEAAREKIREIERLLDDLRGNG